MTVEKYILDNKLKCWKVFKNSIVVMTDKTIDFMILDDNEYVYELLKSEIVTVVDGIEETTLVI